jgi:hypothetical protein
MTDDALDTTDVKDITSIADELYALAPNEFTSTRDGKAADARRAGDKELAASIKGLRRPTISAWLANLLVEQHRSDVSALVDLGVAMRKAQEDLAADELRQLSKKRRELVSALAVQAKEIAKNVGQPVTGSVIQELEETLEAAVADEDAASAVMTGHLTTSLMYSGFGPVDVTGAIGAAASSSPLRSSVKPVRASLPKPAVAGSFEKGSSPAPAPAKKGPKDREAQRRKDALDEVDKVRQSVAAAKRAFDGSEKQLRSSQQKRQRLNEQIEKLESQLKSLRSDDEVAKHAQRQRQRDSDLARRDLIRAEERLKAAVSKLDSLGTAG